MINDEDDKRLLQPRKRERKMKRPPVRTWFILSILSILSFFLSFYPFPFVVHVGMWMASGSFFSFFLTSLSFPAKPKRFHPSRVGNRIIIIGILSGRSAFLGVCCWPFDCVDALSSMSCGIFFQTGSPARGGILLTAPWLHSSLSIHFTCFVHRCCTPPPPPPPS